MPGVTGLKAHGRKYHEGRHAAAILVAWYAEDVVLKPGVQQKAIRFCVFQGCR